MKFLELNLEDIIFETKNNLLNERNLNISGKKLRQVRIGNYGIADLITIKRGGNGRAVNISIYELKKEVVNISTLIQACGYLKGIHHFLKNKSYGCFMTFNITLIGKAVDQTSNFIYFPDLCSDDSFSIDIYTYKYNFDGIFFEKHNDYFLTNPGF